MQVKRPSPGLFQLLLLFILLGLLIPQHSYASHIMGGDLTYRCLSGNQYEVILKLYKDCSGVPLGNTAHVKMTSSCSADTSLTLNLKAGSGNELPLLCPAQQPNSSCNGGSLVGVREFIYADTVTLPVNCVDWTFSWNSCCRNAAITNLVNPSGSSAYLEATLNSIDAPCNSSPAFGAIPTPYICQGQPFTYSQGTGEADGDSLVYSLTTPLENNMDGVNFQGGYSNTNPLSPSVVFDPASGEIAVTPDILQVSVVGIKIEEYRNGILIGTTLRDLQIIVLSCNNIFPELFPASIQNLSAQAIQVGPMSIEVCPGQLIAFDLSGTDANAADSIFISSPNIASLPGATLTSTPGVGSGAASFSWTPGISDVGIHFVNFLVRDNRCPLLGAKRYTLVIRVLDRTSTVPDQIYCPAGGPVQLTASGGSSFTWTHLGGGTPGPGELSCTSCQDPLASPSVTTTYVVTSNLAPCIDKDTVTVTVVPDFSLNTTTADLTLCRGTSTTLSAIASPGTGYTYAWTSGGSLSQYNVASPTATPYLPIRYYVEVTAPTGCVMQDSVDVDVIALEVAAGVRQDKVCKTEATEIVALVTANQPYNLQWYGPLGTFLGTADSMNFVPLHTGFYRTVVQDNGGLCQKVDSVWIDVLDMAIVPNAGLICMGDSLPIAATYFGPTGLTYPASCGLAADCCGPNFNYLVGDTCKFDPFNGNPGGIRCTTYSSVIGPYQMGQTVRQQYIYTQAELTGAGFNGGTIEEIRFHISSLFSQGGTGSPDVLDELEIKIGCTSVDTTSNFLDGLVTVWGPAPWVPQVGLNNHTLDRAYDWDGSGNLVIQICSDDPSATSIWTGVSVSTLPSPGFLPRTVYALNAPNAQPCELLPTFTHNDRPSIGLGVCTEGVYPTYAWTPAAGLSNAYIANPKAAPTITTTYTATVMLADTCLCEMSRNMTITTNGCILGVEVTDFTGERTQAGVDLQWKMSPIPGAFEVVVERSFAGNEFEEIQMISFGQHLDSDEWLDARDAEAPSGKLLYRLRLRDAEGREALSPSILIKENPNAAFFSLSPNPVASGGKVLLEVDHRGEPVRIEILNLQGKVVLMTSFNYYPIGDGIHLQLPQLSPQTYFVRVISHSLTKTGRLMLE